MFGYKIIKEIEIENLTKQLTDAKGIIVSQTLHIADLVNKIKELEKIISTLNETKPVKTDNVEETPVKKVRRKSSKKINKKEE